MLAKNTHIHKNKTKIKIPTNKGDKGDLVSTITTYDSNVLISSKLENHKAGLKRWLSGEKHLRFLERAQVQVLTPTWQLTWSLYLHILDLCQLDTSWRSWREPQLREYLHQIRLGGSLN